MSRPMIEQNLGPKFTIMESEMSPSSRTRLWSIRSDIERNCERAISTTHASRRVGVAIVCTVSILLLVSCSRSNGYPGEVRKSQCIDFVWDESERTGWGVCTTTPLRTNTTSSQLPNGTAATTLNIPVKPPTNEQDRPTCDGTDASCGDPGVPEGRSNWSDDESYEEDGFSPYFNGQEIIQCPEDFWGDEPCG